MKFAIKTEQLLKPLRQLSSIVVGKPIIPILNNILIQVKNNYLLLTSTDLEIEVIFSIELINSYEDGAITVSARKFFDIFRNLPESTKIVVITNNNKINIHANCSRFSLATLPACDFPNLDDWSSKIEFAVPQIILKKLIESTQFSMASQDVRYYLNGMFLNTKGKTICTVTTDGHRLSICSISLDDNLPCCASIIPRKSVLELMHMLNNNNDLVRLKINNNNIRFDINNYTFTSKLINGCFPNYDFLLIKRSEKILEIDCDILKRACIRASIISNEKFRSIRLHFYKNKLTITANNSEQEEVEENLNIDYQDHELEIGFNVNYILDILNFLKCQYVRLRLTNSVSNMWIEDCMNNTIKYCIMPIRL